MREIQSVNTGETITLPEWEGGLSKQEYEQLADGIADATQSNLKYGEETAGLEKPRVTNAADDVVMNLELFELGSYYEQAYQDILQHASVGVDADIARVDTAESVEEQLMAKAGEVLAHDAVRRVLERQ